MIEVFRTNVRDKSLALEIIRRLQQQFPAYAINFDLEDCDKILRVKCTSGYLATDQLLDMLNHWEIKAEVLEDELPLSVSSNHKNP